MRWTVREIPSSMPVRSDGHLKPRVLEACLVSARNRLISEVTARMSVGRLPLSSPLRQRRTASARYAVGRGG